jgi:DNA-directed RNA polymerase subunit H
VLIVSAQNGFDSGSKPRIKVSLENPDQGAYDDGPVAQPGICLCKWALEHLMGRLFWRCLDDTFNQVVASPKLSRESRPAHYTYQKNNNNVGCIIKIQSRMKKTKFKVDKHILTPKHTKLSDKEKNALFEKYKVTSKEMPKIFKTDAAIRELGAKPGDIIKITKISPTAGQSIFYRVVIDV